jgi:hypothetical protein
MAAASRPKYEMTVDLAVLESLGINLYSNAAAVLTELVANAYDADATVVNIDWMQGNERIVVTDNGVGMTVADLNKRFLKAGYKKRETEGLESKKWNRKFMGRKGIGKLSVFSIAKTVIVYSQKSGQNNGLKIVSDDLEARIKDGKPYRPTPLVVPPEYRRPGTTLILEDLKSKRADLTTSALRKRIARRFDVMDTTPEAKGGFKIKIDNKPVTWRDRQELKKLEFIWEFGSPTMPKTALPKGCTSFLLRTDHVKGHPEWKIRGWIGTTRTPSDLTDDPEAGSLKNIIVLARKRPIQEGIIDKLDFSRLFGNYVTGQIEADFLDLDGLDDIATSDRQRMIEDDDRVVGLRNFLRDAFLKAAEKWSAERPKKEAKDLLATNPSLRGWVDARPEKQRAAAERMIGTIASLPMDKDREAEDRPALLKAGVLAFERIGLRDVSDDLQKLSNVTLEDVLPILAAQEIYEEALWGDILRSRVDAINEFRALTRSDQRERLLQEHLFRYLWLFDPSWERATGSERMEQGLTRVAPGLFPKDSDKSDITGRLDIRYVTSAGLHVIIELKKYGRNVEVDELAEQGKKYYAALDSILDQQNNLDRRIQIVFVLGSRPAVKRPGTMEEEEYREWALTSCGGRYVLYDELIENASKQYDEYLQASEKVSTLNALLDTLGSSAATGSH